MNIEKTSDHEITQDELFPKDELVSADQRLMLFEDDKDLTHYKTSEVTNAVIRGDVLDVLPKLGDEVFDLVFLDPPYFLQLPKKELRRWKVNTIVEGVNDKWDSYSSFDEYDRFITNVLVELKRVMKPSATIWAISTYHSVFRIGRIMQDLGYWILNNVIWLKTNPMPNWRSVRFTNATETLIWAVKEKNAKGYTFNKDYAKDFGVGKVGANVWVLPICTGKERLKDEKGKKLHSTQKPEELLKRVILTSSNEGDLVFDPLAGSGTTGYVARALGRRFVMVEANLKYTMGMVERFKIPPKITDKPKTKDKTIQKYLDWDD